MSITSLLEAGTVTLNHTSSPPYDAHPGAGIVGNATSDADAQLFVAVENIHEPVFTIRVVALQGSSLAGNVPETETWVPVV